MWYKSVNFGVENYLSVLVILFLALAARDRRCILEAHCLLLACGERERVTVRERGGGI